MGKKKKTPDTRQNCICRYRGSTGEWICSGAMYHLLNCPDPSNTPDKQDMLSMRGGFILPHENPMIHCRRCSYYCSDFSEYLKIREKLIKGQK